MSLWEIQPYIGIYGLRFGQFRREVRQFLGEVSRSFRKVPTVPETDIFRQLGLRLDYDEEDRLEFIEMMPPAKPEYQGIHLLEIAEQNLLEELNRLGHVPVVDNAGYDFPTLGIGIYKEDDFIQAVSLYRRGYYE